MVKPIVYISACIEHDMCRYDGQFIASKYVKKMKEYIEFKTVCPEMAIGLGTPRESIRLVQKKDEDVKLLGYNSGNDVTEKMISFTEKFIARVSKTPVDGFILKSKSPSCGIAQVKMYKDIGKAQPLGNKNPGMFGGRIKDAFTNIPVEHEMRLTNDALREHFLIQVFTMKRYRDVTNIKELVKFHSINKYLFMVYNQAALKRMGNIVANHNHLPFDEVQRLYRIDLRKMFSKLPNRNRNVNSLLHIYGYFKTNIMEKEKAYFLDLLDKYHTELTSLTSVLRVLEGYVIRFENEYLSTQTIFNPFPLELMEVA